MLESNPNPTPIPETCPVHAALETAIRMMAADVAATKSGVEAIRTNVCGPDNGSAVGLGEQVRDNAAAIAAVQSQIGAVRSGTWQVAARLITLAIWALCGAAAAAWFTAKTGG